MIAAKITPKHLKRTAYIYIRQSSLSQVRRTWRAGAGSTSWRTEPAPWAGARWRWWMRTWDGPDRGGSCALDFSG